MYLLFIMLVFSLALGPDVKLLNMVEADAEPTIIPTDQNTTFLQVTQGNAFTESENEPMSTSNPVNQTLIRQTTVWQTSEHTTVLTSELLTTPEPTTIPVPNTITTHGLSTPTALPKSTPQPKQEEIILTNITTTEPPQTPSPSPTIPDTPFISTKPPNFTPTPTSLEDMETNGTSPTTTPTITTIITTTIQEQTTIKNFDTDTTTLLETMASSTTTNGSGIIGSKTSEDSKGSKKGSSWLIIAIIVLVIFCMLATLCIIAVIFRRRKQSGKQDFGYMNGQRSKKKKGAEEDVWAGPVNLGGGDCAGPEEGDVKGEEKLDDAEMTALSTFTTVEENGGVGRPGSPEVEKWEEQEPLLFIDEEGKEKRKEQGKSDDADAKEGAGRTEEKEAEPNGGESFCLTTAV